MAELPKNIRKPGGDLVSAKSPFTRRGLLPTEADLCNALGITEDEYFQFLEGVAAKVKERPEAYDLVPNLVNGPLIVPVTAATTAAGTAGTLTLLGQIVVGVALSVVAYLLTPKPPSMKQGTNERTADMAGLKRFAPQFSFNSVQELANLGDLIPLVFANRDQNPNGGIRVNSQLMWSQLVSLGRFQQLKLLGLFSLGTVEQKPDFEGYAIGDLLIENYHAKKIYKDGDNIPFLTSGGIFTGATTNIFRVDDERYFSGTRNPTTQATFGLSNPMPNATYYRLPYELVRTASSFNADTRPAGRITLKKRRKLLGEWPIRAGILGNTTLTASQMNGTSNLNKNDAFGYQIVGSGSIDNYDGIGYQQDSSDPNLTMEPHGVDDINAATKTIRESVDSYIVEGEQYMAGTAIVECTNIQNEDWPGQPWDGTFIRAYDFQVIEPGKFECVPNTNNSGLGAHCGNPVWDRTGEFFKVKDNDNKFYYEQNNVDLFDPHSRYTLQKITLGTVSNNRECDITEIGIKSKVFKQISFPNVNSKPSEDKIYDVYNDRSTLSLGQVNKYIKRYSFFKLQVREIGEPDWITLSPATSSNSHYGVFCVVGQTPEFQYNYIRIDHPRNQYEFRFLPWPGNDVIKEVIARETNPVKIKAILLNSNGATDPSAVQQFTDGNFIVSFAGRLNHSLTKHNLSNREWDLGQPSKTLIGTSTNVVTDFNKYKYANYPNPSSSNLPKTYLTRTIFTKATHHVKTAAHGGTYIGPHDTLLVRTANYPRPGAYTWTLYINPSDVTPNRQGFIGKDGRWEQLLENTHPNIGGADTEFHYTMMNGQGGKFHPVLDASLPFADSQGHPFGEKNWYYVKKVEQYGVISPPKVNKQSVSVVGGSGSGLTVDLVVYTNDPSFNRHYAYWTIANPGNNYIHGEEVTIPAENYSGHEIMPPQKLIVTVQSSQRNYGDDIEHELNIYDAAADFWKYEGDQSSHLDGPEHQITYCNEIVKTQGADQASYDDLAYAGLRINSSKEWTNFSQFSAYFKKGIKVKSLLGGSDRATSLFPEIAYALLTDSTIGAGKVINTSSVNEANMTVAANFCKANKFFWDGVISNKVNLREFIFEQGMYCLLDFTIIGGQFSLYPAVPFDSTSYEVANDKAVVIKAMFTDGNIKDLQVAFLSPEDRQTFKANVLYRNEKENGFSENKSKVVRLHGTTYIDDPLETFDLTGFCTSMEHALAFGKYVLATRKFVDHTITFKTAPHYINGVQPGDYIRVFSTTQHVQRFNNGAILDDGNVVSKDTISGSKTFYYWNPSEQVVKEATENFSNPLPSTYRGSLFTIKESEASNQCYKVESITFGEDGLIELSASYAEVTSDGKLAMLQGWNTLFDIE